MSVVYLTPRLVDDPYSGAATSEDWSDPAPTEAPSAFVLSSTTADTSDGQNITTAVAWTLYVPEGEVEPGPRDRVEFAGEVFAIDGAVIREVNPFTGWAPYAQARLTRVGGRA